MPHKLNGVVRGSTSARNPVRSERTLRMRDCTTRLFPTGSTHLPCGRHESRRSIPSPTSPAKSQSPKWPDNHHSEGLTCERVHQLSDQSPLHLDQCCVRHHLRCDRCSAKQFQNPSQGWPGLTIGKARTGNSRAIHLATDPATLTRSGLEFASWEL